MRRPPQARLLCQAAGIALLAVSVLAGCAAPTRAPAPPPDVVDSVGNAAPAVEGRRYEIVPADSLLAIRVFRGGTLARMGHNHLVASHDLAGTVILPQDLTAARFELRFPVAKLTVDEAALRQQEGEEFAAEVPESAREGTRKNMLGEALLDAARFPEIVLKSERIEVAAPGELIAHVQVTVRDRTSTVTVPLHHESTPDHLTATGELTLKQTDLGLTPFSVMMGALQVQDEMKVRFSIRCVAAQPLQE